MNGGPGWNLFCGYTFPALPYGIQGYVTRCNATGFNGMQLPSADILANNRPKIVLNPLTGAVSLPRYTTSGIWDTPLAIILVTYSWATNLRVHSDYELFYEQNRGYNVYNHVTLRLVSTSKPLPV